jgi:hypothetical protein
MIKRIISAVLAVVVLAGVPAMMAGCEQNEYHKTRVVESKDQPVSPQKEVVE